MSDTIGKKEVANALQEIATLMELKGENTFKVRSYTNTARTLEQFDGDLKTLVKEKRLREIKGVGDALEQKIEELVTTGKLEFLEELRAEFPESLFELFGISGLGPKRIKAIYDELGIDSRAKLEAACREGKLSQLRGFSTKMEAKILEGIAFAEKHQGQFRLDKAIPAAETLLAYMKECKAVKQIEVAGSLRRHKEVVKDIDLVASSAKPEAVMNHFIQSPDTMKVVNHGDTKSSILLNNGIAVDLRVVDDKQFAFALAHFTGSKEHNIVMRQRAKDHDLKLNEYGLFHADDSVLACKSEKDIYKALDLPFIPPELREDRGEFDVKKLPKLLEQDDLLGMLHCHTTYSDGRNTLEEMAQAAKDRGYKYILITDHSQSAQYAGGLYPDRIKTQHREIDTLNEKLAPFRILKGIESDIRSNGTLDYEDKVLESFDFIIASVHNKLDMNEAEATKRLITAIKNPYTHILGHPSGRLLLSRPGFPFDVKAVFEACVEYKVAIEINANAKRLDMDWRYLKLGKDMGVMFSIGPDAHSVAGLDDIRYGVGIARKGWLEKENILNCMSLKEVLAWRK